MVDTLSDPIQEMKVLFAVADTYRALDLAEQSQMASEKALERFENYQIGRHSAGKRFATAATSMFTWMTTFGVSALLISYLLRVLGCFLVDAIANNVGDEKFAKALGVTLSTVRKESKIILPD